MNKRLPNTRVSNEYNFQSQPRKTKKRSNKKNNSTNETWYNNDRDSYEQSEDEVPGMEYTFWQQPRMPQSQPHPPHNGQRLFTAMSDPSVCGYSAVPITYAVEPVSLPHPMYHLYQPVVRPNFRAYRGRTRLSSRRVQNGPHYSSDATANEFLSLQENGWTHSTPAAYQNGDYTSLPPTANLDNKDDGEELNSEHRRYSDPGLGPADLPTSKSIDTDSADSGSSITTIEKSSKLFLTLIEQMTKMKESNSQLFKELHQAKTDLENVKTELNRFKQSVPMDYQPGMLTDIIKEIRDASRIKEEAMLSKLRLLMESHQCQRCTEVEQLKEQLEKVRAEKELGDERMGRLEQELAALRLSLNSSIRGRSCADSRREIAAFEEENLALRRELQEARAARSSSARAEPRTNISSGDEDESASEASNSSSSSSLAATASGPVTDL